MGDDGTALIARQREAFHRSLVEKGVLAISPTGIPSNADSNNGASCRIAVGIAERLMAERHERHAGQTSGAKFETIVADYVALTFPHLQHVRPGNWTVMKLGNRSSLRASSYIQYEHLAYLDELTRENKSLSAMIGNDYMVSPDIVVYREPCTDDELNQPFRVVDDATCLESDLRKRTDGKPILHASISAKWTMRSDRAQNSRTEALNLIRNRKGSLPHIVVVTGEPLPSRLASIALGTGDIDCTYHFALYELIESVKDNGSEDAIDMLETLIEGRRLKDISDLPLDLAV